MAIMDAIMNTNKAMTDESIVNDLLIGSKAMSAAYLNATLECATPELCTMYSSSLAQIMQGHAAATALAVDHQWYKAYETPEQQLADAYKKSVSIIEYNK